MRRKVTREDVATFWEAQACGERYGLCHAAVRYQLEPEVATLAGFEDVLGRRLLEIGTGMGADFARFAEWGSVPIGVDLTERGVRITREVLNSRGLRGHVLRADAMQLPFRDASFDIVYSWGVLHHTPDPARALTECQRVLAPGGELRIMLYHRHSWVALAAWVRFCALRGRIWAGLTDAVAHIESPGTRAFTTSEIPPLLPDLVDIDVQPHLTHWDRRWAPGISRLFGDRFGWFLLVTARKPHARAQGGGP